MAAEAEVVRVLRDLIRFDTSNPPGNERPAVDYAAEKLRAAGVAPEIVEPAPRRASLVARLKGSEQSLPALMLSAHLDVVPAEGAWKHPPFEAKVEGGYVWGRGAVDMKHMAAMSLVAFCELARKKRKLRRDLVLALVADEEAGGRFGAGWLVERRPELIKAGFCLTELGGMTIPLRKRVLVPVQTAQKGYVWFKLRARGRGGHGSRPFSPTAIATLARAVDKLSREPLRYKLTPTAKKFLSAVAAAQGAGAAAAVRGLLGGGRAARLALKLLPEERRTVFSAMLHDTVSPTMLAAGVKVNVIPESAEACCDGRYLPGRTRDEFLADVRALVGPDVEVEPFDEAPPLEVEAESELWDVIERVMRRSVPGAEVVPYLIPGMTDAKDYAKAGIKTYGFAPVALKADEPFASLYHAPDERISIAGLEAGFGWLCEIVAEFCGA